MFVDALPEIPPAMIGDDRPLYERWRRQPPFTPLKTFFNVRVGPVRDDLLGLNGQDAQLQAVLLALRIDMLTFSGTAWWVVEFHRGAGLAQFGRLLAYPELLRITYDLDPPLRSMMISTNANPFLEPLWTANNIPVFLYPEANTPPNRLN
ncbi:MAG: hypothetical protein ACYTAO_02410, partial [Planctomycetota bacterium]